MPVPGAWGARVCGSRLRLEALGGDGARLNSSHAVRSTPAVPERGAGRYLVGSGCGGVRVKMRRSKLPMVGLGSCTTSLGVECLVLDMRQRGARSSTK